MASLTIQSGSQAETEGLGRRLGRYLKEKGGRGTVLLYGDLGAGKTTLIRGVASAFGIPEREIGSASFVIVADYETTPPFYHIDLYRIETAEDLDNLGVWEYIDSDGTAVIEWSERLPDLPEEAIKVIIHYTEEDTREITLEGINEADWDHLQDSEG
ncbi:MAG: tRNA (adenosine(37)-N6)-threonylcarbamoyltransferase complex ATPase subunit type 1 TsaE [Nitrospirales bacterium]|nr:tRNA (adenosine(37)-N6)-threonylcarbamoyltransferase complex ATPase subunit type 1 TsaE [Nitrospirales bacterium]